MASADEGDEVAFKLFRRFISLFTNRVPSLSLRERVIENLQALAEPASSQLTLLPSFVHIPDEFALSLGHVVEEAQSNPEKIDECLLQEITRIDGMFAAIGPGDSFWTEEAIRSDPRWEQIRHLAADVLDLLHVPRQRPHLTWMRFVPVEGDDSAGASASAQRKVSDP